MATQSPFSFVGEALEQFVTHSHPPVWVMDETINRLVLFLNHVIVHEPEAQNRLMRQKGRCIQLQWQDKLIQLSPTPAGLLERVNEQKFDLKLSLTDASPLAMASAILKGEKPGVHIEGELTMCAGITRKTCLNCWVTLLPILWFQWAGKPFWPCSNLFANLHPLTISTGPPHEPNFSGHIHFVDGLVVWPA